MSLKELARQWQYSNVPAKRLTYPVAKAAWRTWQFLSVPGLRAQWVTELLHPAQYFQRSTFTAPNRYPELFAECEQQLALLASPKILSYGCATGEEVFSLSERLPHAIVTGVDINSWCIRQCNRRKTCDGQSFYRRNSRAFRELECLDAILCLAVFQRAENRADSDVLVAVGISFSQFESELEMLDAKLTTGGLLFIDHTDFDFTETALSRGYRPLAFEANRIHYKRPLFDKFNRRVSDEQNLLRGFAKTQ